jgi:hypothetical protein
MSGPPATVLPLKGCERGEQRAVLEKEGRKNNPSPATDWHPSATELPTGLKCGTTRCAGGNGGSTFPPGRSHQYKLASSVPVRALVFVGGTETKDVVEAAGEVPVVKT